MKRLSLLLLFALLGGCLIVTPGPTPPPATPLKVLEATYGTDFAVNDQPVICDNRTTQLSYRFRFEGELQSWVSYLKGTELREETPHRTFTPGADGVTPSDANGYEVTYTLGANSAPYAVDNKGISSKAIVVVPVPQPQVIGNTILHLILQGANGETANYTSRPIPVVINCPAG